MASKDTETNSERRGLSWESQKGLIEIMRSNYVESKKKGEATEFDRHHIEGLVALVEGEFDKAYLSLEMMVREILDPYAFAVLDIDEERGVYRRVYSSHPDELPVTDDRPLPAEGHWAETIKRRQVMYTNSLSQVAAYIPDSAECLAMGCLCCGYMLIHGEGEDREIFGMLALFAKTDFFNDENMKALAKKGIYFLAFFIALRQALKHETPAS